VFIERLERSVDGFDMFGFRPADGAVAVAVEPAKHLLGGELAVFAFLVWLGGFGGGDARGGDDDGDGGERKEGTVEGHGLHQRLKPASGASTGCRARLPGASTPAGPEVEHHRGARRDFHW